MKKGELNPALREYKVGDRDKVFTRSKKPELINVEVVSLDKDEHPIFKALDGSVQNSTYRHWEVVFT